MNTKELLNNFRAAVWRSAEEVERFVTEAPALAAADVEKLLELSVSRLGTSEQQRQRTLVFHKLAEKVQDKNLFGAYLRALRAADPGLRSALAQLMPKVNNVSEHSKLVALLRLNDAPLRKDVAQILSAIGSRSVFEMLGDLVKEPSFPGRMEALDAAVAIAPHHALPTLQAALEVGNETEKMLALSYLSEPRCAAKDPTLVRSILVNALSDASEAVVVKAIGILSSLGPEEEYFAKVIPLLEARSIAIARAVVDGLRAFPSPAAVSVLHRRLRLGPNAVRFAALDVLEAIGTSDVLEPLVEAIAHPQVAVRTRAGEILMRLGQAGKIDIARTVIWLLRSRDVNVRRMAVELVQTVRDPNGELWPKLLDFLRDEDWWVRERVMDALVDMAGEQLLRHLVAFVVDPSDVVRRFGVDALLRLKSAESLGTLLRTARSDPDWWVRERALEAVGAIGDPRAIPHVVDLMRTNPQLRVSCLATLAVLEASSAAEEVAALLDSEDGDVQLAALRCLKVVGGAAQASAVQSLARDPRPEVRMLARELVTRWGAAGAEQRPLDQVISALDQLLITVAHAEGDDLILATGWRPLMKRLGRTEPIASAALPPDKVKALIAPHLSLEQLEGLEAGREVDLSYRVETEDLRFRVNVFQQLSGVGAVFRIIKSELPELEKLGLPPVVARFADLTSGLVLVGGATGSGKSTTLAALIDRINRGSRRHVVTLEDPIEVVHPRKSGLINQREVGTHTGSFAAALRATLRQDPDVILMGELRDLPTISFAVSAAETGHLVFGTIHTVSAAGTVDRLVNAFPANQQDHIRALLAGSLHAVVCQYLLPRANGPGRCLAVEVMLNNDAVANLIRKGKTFQIASVIATSREQGMQLMDAELLRLARAGEISPDEAYARAVNKKDFEGLLQDASLQAPARTS